MGLFDLLLVGCGGVYLAGVCWLLLGLGRNLSGSAARTPGVTVVVAARNEAASIGPCLRALREQEYGGPLEIIVVDDRSDDGTGQQVLECAGGNVKLVEASPELRFACPKKSALAQGIEASSGELLLFTDADCRPGPNWVRSTAALFDEEVGLATGKARPETPRLFRHRLLALDSLAIGALAAGSIGMGRPLACTGRNLAYRRRVYDQVGGFAAIGHLVGGDDVYFARLVTAATDWKTAYNRAPDGVVWCDPGPASWGGLVQQKLRHAAKAGHYKGAALGLAGAVYLFHLALFVGLVQLVAGGPGNALVLAVWGIRWAVDLALLWRFAASRCERKSIAYLPFLELCYIPYVLVFPVLGGLGLFRWKR